RGGLWVVVAVFAAIAATATATLDITENLRTTAVLGGDFGQRQLDALRHVSLAKWTASATTVTLLAWVFAQRGWIAVLTALLLVAAGIGFAGLRRHGLLQAYLIGVGILALAIAILLLVRPHAVTRHL